MTIALQVGQSAQEGAVVTKAFIRAGQQLGLSGKQLAAIIDVSEAQISRMGSGLISLHSSNHHSWDGALLLTRIYLGLLSMFGDLTTAKLWLHGYNTALRGIPVELIANFEGLIDVTRYVEFSNNRF
jgi:hypothetical protein